MKKSNIKQNSLLTKLTKKLNLNRNAKDEEKLIINYNDIVGCTTYKLKGVYTYNEVIKLNKLTHRRCSFGFCKELGPIAFIGILNATNCNKSGYFKHNIHTYGKNCDEGIYYFISYSDEDAKQISNFTVFGDAGLEVVSTKAPIEQVHYISDFRYRSKKGFDRNHDKAVIEMDLKLSGTYTFDEACALAIDNEKDKKYLTGEDYNIQFAVVDDTMYVGIINIFCETKNDLKFRDVWEYGCDEPPLQKIRFLTKSQAQKINAFSIYIYVCPYNLKNKNYPIEKKDRTFDPRFDFKMPDGRDYRLN